MSATEGGADAGAVPGRKRWPTPLAGLAVAVALAVLGAPLGWLWSVLAPEVPLIKTEGGARLTEPQPEEFVAADGWFTLLGFGFGVLAAIAVWALLRRYRGPFMLLGLAVGTVGAALVAWWLGGVIGGQGDFDRLAASAPVGTPLSQPAELRAGGFEWLWGVIPTLQGDVLLPAFGAVVTYTLLAGWSRYPSLRPEPGVPEHGVPGQGAPEHGVSGPGVPGQGAPPVSWGSTATPAHPAEPARPGPGEAAPPPG